jgi:hypothetical protein
MKNKQLGVALADLTEAIDAIMLGSIQATVIEEAGKAMIQSWNEHNTEDHCAKIDTELELVNWVNRLSNERSSIVSDA